MEQSHRAALRTDIFAMILRPNYILPNKATHEKKAARAKALWPWLTSHPLGLSWPEPSNDCRR
jgi:hypothetical protein